MRMRLENSLVFFAVQSGCLRWLLLRCIMITIHDLSTRMTVCIQKHSAAHVSEWTPVIGVKSPSFARRACRYLRASCGAAKRPGGTRPGRGVPRLKLDTNTRTGARATRERRWVLMDNPGVSPHGDVASIRGAVQEEKTLYLGVLVGRPDILKS